MELITWDDSLSVKVKEIDEQHKKLIRLINSLHEAMIQRKTKEALGTIINELMDYTTGHFLTEETYFEKFEYGERDSHKREHTGFVNKVSAFHTDFQTGKMFLSMEIMNFLKDWLIKHIKGTDKKYGPLFNSRGLM
ncbi:MAG: bacteriohemerythrin [Proteobacteria bacterium]|nr:bacteriohemerythrin [Pseudomonadota bacterium]